MSRRKDTIFRIFCNGTGMFDACLKETCAWYDDDDMCAVQSLTMISETLLKIYYDKNKE